MSDSINRYFSSASPQEIVDRSYLEQFLRFHLVPNTTALLPVGQIKEAIKIPLGKIIPIADLPAWVMGVYNGRGEILWTIDLGLMLGLTPWHKQLHRTSNYTTIVIRGNRHNPDTQETTTVNVGLVVHRVEDMDPKDLQTDTSDLISATANPFVSGYWLKTDGELRLSLDGDAILAMLDRR
jgi:positive phototaxis protein PixI